MRITYKDLSVEKNDQRQEVVAHEIKSYSIYSLFITLSHLSSLCI